MLKSNRFNRIVKNNKNYLFLFLLAFYLLYMPDFSNFFSFFKNSNILLFLAVLLTVVYGKKLFNFCTHRKWLYINIVFILLSYYTIVVTYVNNYSLSQNITGIILPLKLYLLMYLIMGIFYCYENRKDRLSFVLNLGTIQAIICILMMAFQPLKEIANQLYISGIPNYYELNLLGITTTRIFGIASDYTFSFAILLSIIASLSFIQFIEYKEKKYAFISLLNMLASLLNGRTGFFIFLATLIIIIIIYYEKNKFSLKKLIFFSSVIVIVLLLIINVLDDSWTNWFNLGLIDLKNLLTGKLTGTFLALSKVFYFPKGIHLWLGIGSRIYGDIGIATVGAMSDIGYVNDIFRGGLVYALLFYSTFIIYTLKILKVNSLNRKYKCSIFVMILLFGFISNFKGESLSGSSIFLIMILISSILIEENSNNPVKTENENPLVSVLLTVYNRETVIDTIMSILKQSYQNFEFIIIDNNSTDNTVKMIQELKDPRIKIFVNEENKGQVFSLNKGLTYCTGKYIARIDADDLASTDRLLLQVSYLEEHPEVVAVGSNFQTIDSRNRVLANHKMPLTDKGIRAYMLMDSPFAHPSVTMRTEIINQYKLFYNTEYKISADYKLWLDLSAYGELANLPQSLLMYRIGDNDSNNNINILINDVENIKTELLSILSNDKCKLYHLYMKLRLKENRGISNIFEFISLYILYMRLYHKIYCSNDDKSLLIKYTFKHLYFIYNNQNIDNPIYQFISILKRRK